MGSGAKVLHLATWTGLGAPSPNRLNALGGLSCLHPGLYGMATAVSSLGPRSNSNDHDAQPDTLQRRQSGPPVLTDRRRGYWTIKLLLVSRTLAHIALQGSPRSWIWPSAWTRRVTTGGHSSNQAARSCRVTRRTAELIVADRNLHAADLLWTSCFILRPNAPALFCTPNRPVCLLDPTTRRARCEHLSCARERLP